MENRSEVVREYFDLIVYLNQSNVSRNKKTEITFEIRKTANIEEFGCYLRGVKNPNLLVLCKKTRGLWQSANNTKFIFLEDFCSGYLDLHGHLAVDLISKNLRSLGLKK